MKRIILFFVLITIIATSCSKEDSTATQKVITIDAPGNLTGLLSEEEILNLTELTISGPLNGLDIKTIRTMATHGALAILDLSETSIVEDCVSYYDDYENNTYYTANDEISTYMFKGCKKLQKINLPRNIKTIGEEAFYYCNKLISVTFHNGIDSIGERAFYKTKINGELNLPESLRIIGRQAFADTEIETVLINSNIEAGKYSTVYSYGGNSVFAYCDRLKTVLVKEGCTKLEIGFQSCDSLNLVILPSTLLFLGQSSHSSGNHLFYFCPQLQSISLPGNLQFIGELCFSHSGIQEMTIPKSVNTIKDMAFGSTELKTFRVFWEMPLQIPENTFRDVQLYQSTLYVPSETYSLYRAQAPWSDFLRIIEE